MNTGCKSSQIAGAFLLLLCLLPSAYGEAQHSGAKGIDLILIFDKSRQPWNDAARHVGPDPENARKQRINLISGMALSFLSDDLGNQVSIISYADRASTIKITEFANPSELLRRLEREFNSSTFADESNVLAALDKVKEIKSNNRKREIVLITHRQPSQYNWSEVKKRLESLQQETELLVRVIFTGMFDGSNFWAQQNGIHLIKPEGGGSAQLFDRAEDILASSLKFNTVKNPGARYSCPPFLRRLVIKVTTESPQHLKKVWVDKPDEQGRKPDISNSTGLAVFVFENPLPGDYKIAGINEKNTAVHIEEYPPFLTVISPDKEVHPLVEEKFLFALTSGANRVLEPKRIEKQVAVNIRINESTKPYQPIKMDYVEGELAGNYTFSDPGDYKIVSLSSASQEPKTWKIDLVTDEAPFIKVNNRPAYKLRLIEPDPAQSFKVTPFTNVIKLRFQLETANNKKVQGLVEGIKDPNKWLTLQLYDIDKGVALHNPIELKESNGEFTADLSFPRVLHPLDAFKARNIYFQIQNMDGDGPIVNSIVLADDPAAKSIEQDPMRPVGHLGIEIIWWIWVAAGLLLLLLLVLVIVFLNAYILIPRRIRREDEEKKRTVRLKIYDQVEDPNGVAPKIISLGKAIHYKLDSDAEPAPLNANRFRLRRLHSNGPAEAMIKYRWKGSRKTFETRLRAGKLSKLKSSDSDFSHRSFVATLEEF